MEKGSKPMSNTAWGFFIGIFVMIDLVEIGLDALYGVGLFVNPLIDVLVACSLLFYCRVRGIKLTKTRVISIISCFGIEAFAGEGVWVMDAIFILLSVKGQEYIDKFAGQLGAVGQMVKMAAQAKMGGGGPQLPTKLPQAQGAFNRLKSSIAQKALDNTTKTGKVSNMVDLRKDFANQEKPQAALEDERLAA